MPHSTEESQFPVKTTIAFVVALLMLWFFRPWLHGILMAWRVYPLPWLCLLLTLISAVLVLAFQPSDRGGSMSGSKSRDRNIATFSALAAAFFAVSFLWHLALHGDRQLYSLYQATEYNEGDGLPDTDQYRLIPYKVAKALGKDKHQEPTHKLYNLDPQLWEGKFSWVTARTPDGLGPWVNGSGNGVAIVDGSTSDIAYSQEDVHMPISEGVIISDDIRWALYKERYFVDLPEVLYSKHEGEIVALVPIIAYEGWWTPTPYFDGCYMVQGESITTISREDCATHPAVQFAGRIYPEQLTRKEAEAYSYKNGIWNMWFKHREEHEISDPSGESNGQPYVISTKDGLRFFTSADPFGDSYAVLRIFVTDAITGRHELNEYPREAMLTGAQSAAGYVRTHFPNYNWYTSSGESSKGNIVAIEPRPAVVKGVLHWLFSISSTEYRSISSHAIVNAETNEVLPFDDDAGVLAYVKSGVRKQEIVPEAVGVRGPPNLERLEELLKLATEELQRLKAAE